MDHESPWRELRRSTRQLVWMNAVICVLVTVLLVQVFILGHRL
jgi:hypothetical protein